MDCITLLVDRKVCDPQRTRHQAQRCCCTGVIVYSAAVSQSEGEGVVGTRPDLRELNKDDFYPALEEAGTTLVVVDFYTNWCVVLLAMCWSTMSPQVWTLQGHIAKGS